MKSIGTIPSTPRRRGRPLSFDRDEALRRAMLLFWEHGYEATSLNDLTAALGVTPSSIYTAFGDKKGLFMEAVNRYLTGPVNSVSIVDQAPTAYDAALGLMRAAAVGFTGKSTPRGCLLASSAVSCSPMAQDVREALANLRRGIEAHLSRRIEAGIKAGELPAGTSAKTLAAHTMAVIQGMSTLARDGASRASLLRLVDVAARCWPEVGSKEQRAHR